MTWTTPPADAGLGELAAILGRGYLRLTQDAHNLGTFGPREPQKPLDLSGTESGHVSDGSTK